jgi:aryl-alcohol dehydrogenase-like predicted oxidoreductase
MKYREFGKTGLKVSEVGFGCWAIGGNEHGNSYGQTDDKVSIDAIQKAIELGCNFFDTADVYGWGHSEELLGKAVRAKRDHLIIATKVGGDFYQGIGYQTFTADYVRFALDKSLERLKTDYVDVYQLHNPSLKILNKPETYEVLKELKKEGKIRAWGVSIFDPIEGLAALKIGHPDSLQVAYNIFSTKPSEQLFPKANEQGCAIIGREPLANGFLTGKYLPDTNFEQGDIRNRWPRDYIAARVHAAKKVQTLLKSDVPTLVTAAIKYVLMNEHVSVVIPGAKTPAQVLENLAASDFRGLNKDELKALAELQGRGFTA